MQFDGAKIKEQGVTFGIVVVKPYVLRSPSKEQIRASFIPFFGNIPIILMAQEYQLMMVDLILYVFLPKSTQQEFLGNIILLLRQRKDSEHG